MNRGLSRELLAEFFGTFILIVFGVGVVAQVVLSKQAAGSYLSINIAWGLAVAMGCYVSAGVTGAHLNPAVTFAFWLRGDFPIKRVPGYIIIQLIGASLACLFLRAVFGRIGNLGATLPGPGVHDWQAMLIELALTAGLVSTILGTASRAQNVGPLAALGVGSYIILAGLWSSPISGASMNPARSFGPDLVLGDFSSYWVYVVGPLAGAAIAVGFAFVLRGKGGDEGGLAAARGALPDDPDTSTTS